MQWLCGRPAAAAGQCPVDGKTKQILLLNSGYIPTAAPSA